MISSSLRFKINSAILLTAAIIAVFLGVFLYFFERNHRQTRIEKVKVLMGAVFEQKKEQLTNEVFAGQRLALADTLAQMKAVKGIYHLVVYDIEGRIVIATGEVESHVLSQRERHRLNQSPVFINTILHDRPTVEYAAVMEVIGERVGYLKMYYDMIEVKKELNYTLAFFFSFLLITLIVMAVLLNLLLTRSVIVPATLLRNAIRKVRKGGIGEQVVLTSGGEIGEIASDFNRMSLRLQKQHVALAKAVESRETYAVRLEKTNQELEFLNASLEAAVNDRTAELLEINRKLQNEITERQRADEEKRELEERLARSQKMEALGLLAGGVAHDLNNVLSGIVSYPDLLLLDLEESSPLRKPIMTIKDSGRKAATIVQDLLDLARRGVTHTEVINLNDDIISAHLKSPEQKKILLHHPDIDILTSLAPDLMNIRGSSVHLKKALMNLITNAAEAQPHGGKIKIHTENRYVDRPIRGYDNVDEGDYVVLTVRDRGTGIAPDDLNRIFEPFYSKKIMGRSGTGLGMAVVWGTVQDHQGYIDVESTEGEGTDFSLYFPITREEKETAQRQVYVDELFGNGETLLVVDDIKEQVEIASHILKKLGYSVRTAASGEEAVDYIKAHAVDLVVLDMIMEPGIDGLETYRQILKHRPGQKAIIASGFAENQRVREALTLGVGQYIKKPYTLEKIGLAVKQELDRSQ